MKKKYEELMVSDIVIIQNTKGKDDYGFLAKKFDETKVIELDLTKETAQYKIEDDKLVDVIGSEPTAVNGQKFLRALYLSKQSTKNLYKVECDSKKLKNKDLLVSVIHNENDLTLIRVQSKR